MKKGRNGKEPLTPIRNRGSHGTHTVSVKEGYRWEIIRAKTVCNMFASNKPRAEMLRNLKSTDEILAKGVESDHRSLQGLSNVPRSTNGVSVFDSSRKGRMYLLGLELLQLFVYHR